MRVALATICPDARQRRFLSLVRPGWEDYAHRHGLPLRVVDNPPAPEHVYWGKYLLLGTPEFDEFDAVLHLDNDVFINPAAPSIVESWDPGRVGMVDERAQLGWDDAKTRAYFDFYGLGSDKAAAGPILNGGVVLIHRAHLPLLREIFERWLEWRATLPGRPDKRNYMRFINDQPHVTLALTGAGAAQTLDARFNFLFAMWFRRHYPRVPYPVLLIYTKTLELLRSRAPGVAARLGASGRRMFSRALADAWFLHVAGSKSPAGLAPS